MKIGTLFTEKRYLSKQHLTICDPPSFPCFVCLPQTAQVDEVFEFPTATSCVKR
jgi:hypothetical protein